MSDRATASRLNREEPNMTWEQIKAKTKLKLEESNIPANENNIYNGMRPLQKYTINEI